MDRRDQTVKTKADRDCTLGRYGYRFPPTHVTPELRKKVAADLSVLPVVNEAFNHIAVPVKVWMEGTDGSLYVPPKFGCASGPPPSLDWGGHLHERGYRPSPQSHLGLIASMPPEVRFNGSLDPRLHQPEATSKALEALRGEGRCMVAQHTGAGKTVCALAVAAALGLKTLVIVHKGVLMDQWVDRVRTFLPAAKVGKVCQDVCESQGYDIVVAMLQSVERREYPGLTDHGLLILDEVHRFAAAGFSRILFKVNAPHVLGLSATPERRDGLTPVINWWLGDVVFRLERENQRHVRVRTVYTHISVPVKVNRMGRVDMCKFITSLCEHPGRNEMLRGVVGELLREGRAVLYLTDRRTHAEAMAANFPEHAHLLLGGRKTREPITERHRLLCSTYSMCREGVDVPHLDSLILSSPKSDVNQICGRVLREHHARNFDPLIVDFVDDAHVSYSQYRRRQDYFHSCGFML